MKALKKYLAITLTVIFSALQFSSFAAEVSDFSDFPSDWSATALNWAVENDILRGYDGNIKGTSNISRAELATIINRVAFDGDADAINTYLSRITSVTVGTEEYTNSSSFYSDYSYRYRTVDANGSSYSTPYAYLDLTTDGFAGETTVKITANGYEDLEFTITGN